MVSNAWSKKEISSLDLDKKFRLNPNITLNIDPREVNMFNTPKLEKQINQAIENLGSKISPYYIFLGSAETLGNYWGGRNNVKVGKKELNLLPYNYMQTPALNETEQENFKNHPYRFYMKIQKNWNSTFDIDWVPGEQKITISFELLEDTNKHKYKTMGLEEFSLHSKKMNLAEFLDWYAQYKQHLSIPEEIVNNTNKVTESTSSTSNLKRGMGTKILWVLGKSFKGDKKKQP